MVLIGEESGLFLAVLSWVSGLIGVVGEGILLRGCRGLYGYLCGDEV